MSVSDPPAPGADLFAPLIGHQRALRLFSRSVAQDRVSHAYLLVGPSGAGKTTAALQFGALVNCAGPEGEPPLACGRCVSCRAVAAGTHPDMLVVEPGSASGQEVTVDQARDLRKAAALRPRLGRRHVFIVPRAETLNESASNALLKTIEEPGSSVTLIFAAPGESQVLPTIRSRCQLVRLTLCNRREIETGLIERGAPAETASLLARLSGGAPGRALRWASQPELLELRERSLALFATALDRRMRSREQPWLAASSIQLAEEAREQSESWGEALGSNLRRGADHLLGQGLTLLRDLLLITEGAPDDVIQNSDWRSRLDPIRLTREEVAQILTSAQEARKLLDHNVTPQAVLERFFWVLIAGERQE